MVMMMRRVWCRKQEEDEGRIFIGALRKIDGSEDLLDDVIPRARLPACWKPRPGACRAATQL